MRPSHCTIAPASLHQAPAIRAMQERSLRSLGSHCYTSRQIEAFIRCVGTLDERLIAEGHYFVAASPQGGLLASGGWSVLAPRFAAAAESVGAGCALVRSVFVAPEAARQGLGSAILRHSEDDALRHGVEILRLTATRSGLPLYLAHGYEADRCLEIGLPGTEGFACVDMHKRLALPAACPMEIGTSTRRAGLREVRHAL